MNRGTISLFKSLRVLFARLIKRRIHFPKRYLGKNLLMEDGQKFQVIRHLEIKPKNGQYKSFIIENDGVKIAIDPGQNLHLFKLGSLIPKLSLKGVSESFDDIQFVPQLIRNYFLKYCSYCRHFKIQQETLWCSIEHKRKF